MGVVLFIRLFLFVVFAILFSYFVSYIRYLNNETDSIYVNFLCGIELGLFRVMLCYLLAELFLRLMWVLVIVIETYQPDFSIFTFWRLYGSCILPTIFLL